MARSSVKPPSQRQLRVGEEIRHALAGMLARGDRLPDPALAELNVTVTEVRMSPDLRIAWAYVRALDGGETQAAIKLLAEAANILRREVAREVRLKYVPQLRFLIDTSFDEAARIDALLDKVRVSPAPFDPESLEPDDEDDIEDDDLDDEDELDETDLEDASSEDDSDEEDDDFEDDDGKTGQG
jgi:ribosome-binding factor A